MRKPCSPGLSGRDEGDRSCCECRSRQRCTVRNAHPVRGLVAAESADEDEEDSPSGSARRRYCDEGGQNGNGAPRGRSTVRGNLTQRHLRSISRVSRGGYHTPPRVRSCVSPASCSRRTEYPTSPPSPVFPPGWREDLIPCGSFRAQSVPHVALLRSSMSSTIRSGPWRHGMPDGP